MLGHDVGPGPAVDCADVDGHARPAAVERVQRDRLVGRLQGGAATLLGLDAGVGRAAVDGGPDVHHALARGDDVAVGAGGLHDEGGIGATGQLGDERLLTGEPISSSGLTT